MTLLERIQWCVVNRAESARSLSLKGGLSAGTIGKILERSSERVSQDTLRAIARASGVSERWLLLGEGQPDDADGVTPPTPAPDDAPPVASSIPGWPESRRIAKVLRDDLPDAALDKAEASARLLTTAHATPELVIQLAELALRFAGPDLLEKVRAEGLARTARDRDAYDELHEHGTPLPPGVRSEQLTPEGQAAMARGEIPAVPPTYRGSAATQAKRAKR